MDPILQFAPILNAAGIPILALAMAAVIRAYKHLADAHKKQSEELSKENERLRKQIAILDESSLQHLERASRMSLQSVDTIIQLQNRKTILLSTAAESNKRSVESEVSQIDEIIRLVDTLSEVSEHFKQRSLDTQFSLGREFRSLLISLGQMTDKLTDVPSKLASMKVVLPQGEQKAIAETLRGRETALPHSSEPKPPELGFPTPDPDGEIA